MSSIDTTTTDTVEISENLLNQLSSNNPIINQNLEILKELSCIKKFCESINERLSNLEKNIDKSSEFAINRARETDIAVKKKKIENLKHLLTASRSVFTDSQIETMKTSLRILETEVAQSMT
jgi:hypothetical protein